MRPSHATQTQMRSSTKAVTTTSANCVLLCLINTITAGWGKKKGMDHCHPLELLYKFNYLLTNSDWGDYSVWLNNLSIKLGYCVSCRVVQPPKAMEGKWGTIEAAGEWALEHWKVLLLLAEECSIGVRAGGLISAEHFQKAEWERVLNWMRQPTMQCSIAWITELSNIVVGWQNWSKARGQFGVSFRTTELAKHVQQRVEQAQQVDTDPWNSTQFPRALECNLNIRGPIGEGSVVEKLENQVNSAATVFEEETRFWFQQSMRLPTVFWLFTDLEVGPYFLSKVLQVVMPDCGQQLEVGHSWAASDEQQAEIDLLFTTEWHAQYLRGLKDLALSKCQKNQDLVEEYDFKADLICFWLKHDLQQFEDQWLSIVNGSLAQLGFDIGSGVDDVFKFALRHGIVHSHRNGATEACMRKLLIYGDKSMDLLRHECKLLMNDTVLEQDRIARRQPELRCDGAKKQAGHAACE